MVRRSISDTEADGTAPPSSLWNLGASSDTMLAEVGITTAAELRALGAMEAWERLRFAHGKKVTTVFLYALEGALTGCDWRYLPRKRIDALKAAATAYLQARTGQVRE